MSGLISRKQTIDALRTCYDTERIDYDNGKEYIDYEQALDLIKELPSAEQTRCKDCKYYYNTDPENIPTANIICFQMHEDDYCSYADRRADE